MNTFSTQHLLKCHILRTFIPSQFRLHLQMLQYKLNRSLIPKSPQPTNNRNSLIAQKTLVAEFFPLVDVRDVHFYEGDANAAEGVPESHGGVGECCWVDNNSINLLISGLVYPINHIALMVRLEVKEFVTEGRSLRDGF